MKTSLALIVLLAAPFASFAEAPEVKTELRKTLSAASQQKKLAFILLGRPACGNCNATKTMIREGKIPVAAADYVMGDLNIDDPKTEAEFTRKYRKEQFGNVLPFVVIADSSGKALASTSGYKKPEQWNAILAEARAKADQKPGAGAAGDSNWPFQSPPRQ